MPFGSTEINDLFFDVVTCPPVWAGKHASASIYDYSPNFDPIISISNGPSALELPAQRRNLVSLFESHEGRVVRIPSKDIEIGDLEPWTEWVERLTPGVGRELGLGFNVKKAVGPGGTLMAELQELVVCKPGGTLSVAESYQTIMPEMVGYMAIILPSVFSGGIMSVTHDGKSPLVIKPGATSKKAFHVVAWYSDACLDAHRINKGCMAAFIYTLHYERSIHGLNNILPSASLLGTTTCFEARLKHVFDHWTHALNHAAPHNVVSRKTGPLKIVIATSARVSNQIKLAEILTRVAIDRGFRTLEASFRYEETRFAYSLQRKKPKSGFFEQDELELESDGVEPTNCRLEWLKWNMSTPGASGYPRWMKALERALGDDQSWNVDPENEVVTWGIFQDSLLPDEEDWSEVDFAEGEGPVVCSFLVPVIVIFPKFKYDLVLADAAGNSKLRTTPNNSTFTTPAASLRSGSGCKLMRRRSGISKEFAIEILDSPLASRSNISNSVAPNNRKQE